jgi:serine/threonine protein kinase
MHDYLIGQRLANYRVERLLGRGGMASIYLGRDVKLDRPVAIKTIDVLTRDVAYAERLVHEARIVAKWRHENIVQVYYADQQDGLYYFAMEYIDGLDLGQLMALYTSAGEMIPHADVVKLGRSITNALDFAHAQGVIHRDVKPSNVLLSADGRVVLTDFGLALDVEQGSKGEVLGTPHYVAPEQARSSRQTVPQSDLYSLGVILYEMLTGSVPFDDPSPMSLALKHITEPPPLPTSINPRLNIATEAVLLKALSKSPSDRYATGLALMDALEVAVQPLSDMPPLSGMRTLVAVSVARYMQTKAEQINLTPPAADTSALIPSQAPAHGARPTQLKAISNRQWTLLTIGIGVALILATLVCLLSVRRGASLFGTAPTSTPAEAGIPAMHTSTGTPAPSSLPEASAAPINTPASTGTALPPIRTALPTILYSDGYKMILRYTDGGFYLYNPGDRNIEVMLIAFEALDSASGLPMGYHFEGKIWAQFYPYVEDGKCANIEILAPEISASRPAVCWSFNAMRTPDETSTEIFWLPRQGVTHFRVLWDGQEIARCEVGSGICEIYVPQ